MRKITQIFFWSMVALVAAYDVFAIVKGGTEASISHMLIIASYKHPVLPFVFGFTCGHLFWRMGDTADTQKIKERNKDE